MKQVVVAFLLTLAAITGAATKTSIVTCNSRLRGLLGAATLKRS